MLKKRFAMFVMMLLIVSNTIIAPLTTVGAAGLDDADPATIENIQDNRGNTGGSDGNPDASIDGTGSTEEPETPAEPGDKMQDKEEDESTGKEEAVLEPNKSESGKESESSLNSDAQPEDDAEDESENEDEEAQAGQMDQDVALKFGKLVINGKEIKDPNEASGIEAKIGDKVDVHYSFDIRANQDYGVGSTFTFQLPQALLNFDPASLSGTLTVDDIQLKYSTQGRTVTVKLENGTIEEGSVYSGTLHFSAHFSADGTNGDLEQELLIPIAGGEDLTFTFFFKPQSNGQSMTKTGKAAIGEDGNRYIDWEVWTNREGADLVNAQLNDNLGEGHELSGDIKVEKYKIGLTGVAGTAEKTSTASKFPVALDDGRYAYKLIYRTKVTREPANVTEVFSNKATLSNGSKSDSATASVSHTYGTKLDKEVTKSDKYKVEWQIKYNYFGSKMASQTLTDTVEGPHKINKNSIKVYKVSVNAAGDGTPGEAISVSPVMGEDNKSFSIDLQSPNGEAYLITYETELDSEYVTGGGSVKNEVSYGEEKVEKGFGYTENIFSKSRGAIDYDKKEITWTLKVNVEKDMNSFVITDTFKDYGNDQGGTRQSIVNPEDPFTISGSNVTVKNKTVDENNGFTLELGDLKKGQNFTITYKTKFDILPNGTAYGEYKNTATANWSGAVEGKEYDIQKSASYSPGSSPTGNNGYKNGSFDHVNQVFNWNLAVNINKQNINGATLVDTIGEGHELVEDSIKVHKLTLSGDDKGTKGEEVTSGFAISDKTSKGFTIKFNEDTTDAYIITYQTKDSDNIIGHEKGNSYGNEASFTTHDDRKFDFKASVMVKHANELIGKQAKPDGQEETITWTVDVNKSHSTLGAIILTDKMSDNQLILPDTFKIREIRMNAEGQISYGAWEDATPEINSENNSFTLDLGELNQKGYQVEYKTFFLGADGDKFSNKASINYAGNTAGVDRESEVKDKEFVFNASSGTISSKKGKLELHKVGLDPITGEQVDLEGVTFHLLNKTGKTKIAEAKTDANGKLSFENIRYGIYQLEEQGTPEGYKELKKFQFTMNDSVNIDEENGKPYVVENIKDVDMGNACDNFTLTVKDVDGEPLKNQKISLENNTTGKTYEVETDGNGQVSIPRAELPAGKYKVATKADGKEITLANNVTVQYDGKCEAEIQPSPKCEDFTISLKDPDGNLRAGVEITLKNDDGTELARKTTRIDGTITIPSEELPAGTYNVYEGDVFLGKVVVSYKDKCDAAIDLDVPNAGTCPIFTLEIQDRSGKPRAGVEVTIQDASGNKITTNDEEGNTIETFTTDETGKVALSNTLKQGKYNVYENGKKIGSFEIKNTCGAVIKPSSGGGGGGGWVPAPSCDRFTITVKQDSTIVGSDVELTLKSSSTERKVKTDSNGKIVIGKADLPAGMYTAYDKDGNVVGTLQVSYEENECNGELNITTPGNPTNPTDPPVDPEDPEKPTDPPVNPEEPGKPTDPPVNPEDPGKPTDPPVNPTNPGTENGEKPLKPGVEKPGNIQKPNGSVNNGNVNNIHKENDAKPGSKGTPGAASASDGSTSGEKQNNGDQLPQTGEQRFMYLIALGLLFVSLGAYMLITQSRRKA